MKKSLLVSIVVLVAVVLFAGAASALEWTWPSTIPSSIVVNEDSGTTSIGNLYEGTGILFAGSSADSSKVNCVIGSDGKNLKITPAADFFGTTTCNITATNSTNASDKVESVFTITVNGAQDAPVWTALPDQTMNPSEVKNITLSSYVTDADEDLLTYTVSTSSSTVATCSIASGVLTITASSAEAGSATCTVTANDGHDSASDTFSIATSKLELYDMDVTPSGGSDTNIQTEADGYKVAKEAKPGSEVTVSFILKNTFSDASDIDMEDVTATLTLESMGDEDEQEEELDIGTIDANTKSERQDVTFTVPLKLDEGEYELTLDVEGTDENDAVHSITKAYKIEVAKSSHAVKLVKSELKPTEITCDRSARLDVEVMNIGTSTEKNVVVEVKNSALGIALTQNIGELDKNYDEDNNEWSSTLAIDVSKDAKAGTYTLDVTVYRSSTTVKADAKTVSLVVKDCVAAQPQVVVQTVAPPAATTATTGTTDTTDDEYTDTTETPFLESDLFMMLLIVGIAVVVVLIILLLVLLLRH